MKANPNEQAARQLGSNAGGHKSPDSIFPLLIDREQAAALLGICVRTLDELRKSGALPSRKLRTARRFAVAELWAWVAAGCPTDPDAGERIRQQVSAGVAD